MLWPYIFTKYFHSKFTLGYSYLLTLLCRCWLQQEGKTGAFVLFSLWWVMLRRVPCIILRKNKNKNKELFSPSICQCSLKRKGPCGCRFWIKHTYLLTIYHIWKCARFFAKTSASTCGLSSRLSYQDATAVRKSIERLNVACPSQFRVRHHNNPWLTYRSLALQSSDGDFYHQYFKFQEEDVYLVPQKKKQKC